MIASYRWTHFLQTLLRFHKEQDGFTVDLVPGNDSLALQAGVAYLFLGYS